MRRTRLSLAAAVVAATSAALVAAPMTASAAPKKGPAQDVTVQLLAMNDFHGRITPQGPTPDKGAGDGTLATAPGPDGKYGGADDVVFPVGGAPQIAATVDRLQASFYGTVDGPKDSLFVGAGDLISASPFESSVYKDEPTIEALNAMGLDVSAVGNHEFDRGTQELRRISAATDGTYTDDVTACQGITPGVDGCFGDGEHAFSGAEFPYLAANVVDKTTKQPMLPPYQVFQTPANQKLALIGVVTETTPTIVSPDGVKDVEFLDEADAVNRWVPVLQKQGIQAIGVLVHEGGEVADPNAAPFVNGCNALKGPIVDINQRVSPAVDLIVSAHSHQAYNCKLAVPGGQPRLVTQAGYYGRLVTDIRLSIDRTTGDVNRAASYSATNVPVTRETADAEVQSIVDYWNARSAESRNVVVGSTTQAIGSSTSSNRKAEQPIGNLVAQAQLEAMQQSQYGFPVIAFMNPGGVRADIDAGPTTFGELFTVQPFGNTVNTATLTGAQIDDLLEEQFQDDPDRVVDSKGTVVSDGPLTGGPRGTRLILGTNQGFTYDYDLTRAYGDRVPDASIKLNGVVLGAGTQYRVAANSFLIAGGDSFDAFKGAVNRTTGPVDVDALVAYFKAHSPVSPPPANHGTRIG
ncbi:bifunctional metallophosphatase/5'-nucleotidase [Blastococcus sp. TF02-8]|uniref:bifunctional metallophosphatase/5'-nucleotidase n=1 Tax=Blastococcus sp. TF02-8 TaxID=2250574 RepID=UPI000DEBE5FD|nr:bifunctional metallophosphatase/5'-nucleotidase [Blastococcus sp. TF02-8]RBY96630.1 bifunctional metallophosphatase/5'-nucleotidase [Blastococcus sp. TF02-8]